MTDFNITTYQIATRKLCAGDRTEYLVKRTVLLTGIQNHLFPQNREIEACVVAKRLVKHEEYGPWKHVLESEQNPGSMHTVRTLEPHEAVAATLSIR